MLPRDYFPLGKAHGEAFCNREAETTWLISNILACKHSLLVAPRRFGKSSLADKAGKKSRLPMVSLNFNICTDEQEVESLIRQGVSTLIAKALGPIEKTIHIIKHYVTHLTPTISFGPEYARLEFTAHKKTAVAVNIEETLALIEKLLARKKKRAVLLLDEFQTVGIIAKGSGVEAAIRNAVQNMHYLSVIFSGSNRSLLTALFEDKNRPLYKLCRKLQLKRIEKSHYHKHLQQAARLAWKGYLEDTVFERIMLLSERHPYYVNYLCDVLWTQCTHLPTTTQVDHAWQVVMEEENSDANAEIAQISLGQKKVLKFIANYTGKNLMSVQSTKQMKMALSSIAGAISTLVEKDIIEKNTSGYRIINPIIHCLLKEQQPLEE